MRIACITSSWPDVANPAAGAFVREHTALLRRAGHDVVVFTWRAGAYDEHVHVVSPLGDRSVFNATGAPDSLDRAPWRAIELPIAVSSMLAELQRHAPFDLYLGHWLLPGGLTARLAGDRARRPSAVVGHSGGVHALARLPGPFRRRMTSKIARPTTTTVPSLALAAKLGVPVDVLPMGFDPLAAAPNGVGILLYGRLVEIKGFDRALTQLAGVERPVHVVGSGPEEARLMALAPDATFWGWGDKALKERVFPHCDRAFFPSRVLDSGRHEGWPVSVLEVASAGVVPFVAQWPGSDELVVEPQVQVVADDWVGAATRALGSLRETSIKRAQQYCWASLAPKWLEWVERAATTKPPR